MLTLAVIAKNEEDRLADCLRSVPFATELLVLDSGSTDGTVALAESLGARVVQTDWPGHVAQKNRALELATQPWVLSLDADERLSPGAAAELERALAHPGDAVAFSFPRCSRWRGKPIRHGKWYPDRKVRVVRHGRGRWAGDDPHDLLHADGPVTRLSHDIEHYTYRSVREHLRTIDRYSRISAESLHRRGVRARPWDVLLRPPLHFANAVLLRMGWLDGPEGIAIAGLGSVHVALKWSRLYRMPR